MEPAADAALEDGAEKVLLYTSPEQAAKSEQKREPVATTAVSGAAPPLDAGGEKGGGLPGWIWWVGALALVAIAVFGIRAILGGAGTEEPSPTPVVGADVPLIGAELGDTWTRPLDNMTMVYVPEGSFPMGSEEQDDEKPVHEVSLDAFWIDRTEVTNAQFAEFVDVTGHETTAEEEGSGWIFTGEGWEDTAGADWQHPRGAGRI